MCVLCNWVYSNFSNIFISIVTGIISGLISGDIISKKYLRLEKRDKFYKDKSEFIGSLIRLSNSIEHDEINEIKTKFCEIKKFNSFNGYNANIDKDEDLYGDYHDLITNLKKCQSKEDFKKLDENLSNIILRFNNLNIK